MKFLTDFTYRNLHGFARFPGDSTALVLVERVWVRELGSGQDQVRVMVRVPVNVRVRVRVRVRLTLTLTLCTFNI